MIRELNTIRNHRLFQPILCVGSALLMGRYVCRLPFKATIPLSCVALVAHEISQKRISLSQNILCWSGLGVGSSLIITKCSEDLAKKLPHLMGFWALVGLISHCIRAMPAIVNNVLPNPQAPLVVGGTEREQQQIDTYVPGEEHRRRVDERRQQYRRQSPYSEPLACINFFNDNGSLSACSKKVLNKDFMLLTDYASDAACLANRRKIIAGCNDISPIYLLMGAQKNLCFLQTRMLIGGDRFQGNVNLISSQLQCSGASICSLIENIPTLECEKRILEEVVQYKSQLSNLAQFLVGLLSKDGEEVTMDFEEFNFIRDRVYKWAELLEETHQAPYTDPKKEFGYQILELEKELCQINIDVPKKSARAVGDPSSSRK